MRTLQALIFILATCSVAQAQTCANPKLVNGLNIQLPCVQYQGQTYGVTLDNQPPALSWALGKDLATATCMPDPAVCTQLGSDLSLSIRQLNIGGTPYRVELGYAGNLAWNYKTHSPERAVLTDSVITSIKSYLQQLIVDKTLPGAVLGIAEGSDMAVIAAYGMADFDNGVAMATDNLLHIGSTNKAITSLLAATLVDDGSLTWDSKAKEISPSFTLANPTFAAQVTLRQMLDMSSGLPRESGFSASTPPRKFVDGLGSLSLAAAPGERYEYSNVSTSSAGYLLGLANQKRIKGSLSDADLDNVHPLYDSLLKDRIFGPIGMTSSFLKIDDARATGKMAKSHRLVNGVWTVAQSEDVPIDNQAPSGGIKATASDLLRFVITEMQAGVAPNGKRVASATNTIETQKLSSGVAASNGYGLCLEIATINGIAHIGHNGSFDSFNSVMGFFPDKKIAYVLLTNGDSTAVSNVIDRSGFASRLAALIK